jgi:hypothetical protein
VQGAHELLNSAETLEAIWEIENVAVRLLSFFSPCGIQHCQSLHSTSVCGHDDFLCLSTTVFLFM